eukprot:CAMPEP_0181191898 /NCGR_PEP_ID=MMETSP1096-20121128/12978_1 /TAXON_ID=156174 ORGANISM="Chrysochromulina ericina, Strain CCMP281" /NCGR_SAMPLE_ID=MMETSP1096 /ASSEMBLY_ACC=CAM_ASM_000453 /LENGTH=54 /DNA_ID=CAMNT_0023281223 /DNA_START=144 /DNA_END=308 /DNA_ORIENTATION=+
MDAPFRAELGEGAPEPDCSGKPQQEANQNQDQIHFSQQVSSIPGDLSGMGYGRL